MMPAVGDFDRDERLDLYLCTASEHPNILFHNDGGLIFSDVTRDAGLYQPMLDAAAAVADFNDDGIPDIITGSRGIRDMIPRVTLLYRSKADGTYEAVGEALGMSKAIEEGATWLDVDNDNDLDFVTGIGLYRNDGADGFTDITTASGLPAREGTARVFTLDYDRDNRMDLLFLVGYSREQPPILLLHNEGNGRFTDATTSSRLSASLKERLIDGVVADVNHDGYPDISVETSRENRLFLNDGQGHFVEVEGIFTAVEGSRGSCWGDYDNDGDLDLFTAASSGHKLYQNWGNLSFAEIADRVGLTHGRNIGRPVWADLDNDGDLDLIAPETAYPGNEQEHL